MNDNIINNPPLPEPRPRLSDIFLRSVQEQGRLTSFAHSHPDHVLTFNMSQDRTFDELVKRVQPLMEAGTSESEAASLIARYNNIADFNANGDWRNITLPENSLVHVPMPREYEWRQNGMPDYLGISGLSSEFTSYGVLPPALSANMDLTQDVLRVLNPAIPQDDPEYIEGSEIGDNYVTYITTNDFAHISPLRPSALGNNGSDASLFIVEPINEQNDVESHAMDVFSYAMNYGAALDHAGDSRPEIFAAGEAFHGQSVFNLSYLPSPAQNEYVILNHSYSYKYTPELGGGIIGGNSISGIRDDQIKNIHFISAGNSGGDERTSDTVVAHELIIGGTSYTIGASAVTNGQNAIAAYSSVGADILAPPLPLNDGRELHGTSFASPMMAALGREMLEMYGDILSPQELMAAAYMSTDMNVIDPYAGANGMPVLAEFETNGGGRPHHARAGAGIIEPARWQDNIEIMARMKMRMEHDPGMTEATVINVGQNPRVQVDDNGQTRYSYDITMPVDMTLDRLSFLLETDSGYGVGAIDITAPSGFTYSQQELFTNLHGTSAFALEDVRAGDVMTITTDHPINSASSVILRGHNDGNVVQSLRDYLQENDLMTQPGTTYHGAQPATIISQTIRGLSGAGQAPPPEQEQPSNRLPDFRL